MILVVSMGIPAKNYNSRKEGFKYNGAVIHLIDWEKKKLIKEIHYQSPPEHLGEGLSMQFKGASICNDKYFVVTNTEVLRFDMSSWKLEEVYSHRYFNDLHHVLVLDSRVYVCNTGLEIVQIYNDQWVLQKEVNLASVPTWNRFDRSKDYRLIPTTKPHEVHINHLFKWRDSVWVTRGQKKDVINLEEMQKGIDLGRETSSGVILIHDGLVKDDKIYFTMVDGHIVVVDSKDVNSLSVVDLNKFCISGKRLGWIRGLEIVGNYAFVGSSRLRSSKFKEYTKWIVKRALPTLPSTIIQFDFHKMEIVDYYELERYKGHAIYTILKLPE